MRSMKNTDLVEQNHGDSTTFALADLCSQLNEKRFDTAPLDIGTDWSGKNPLKCTFVRSSHAWIVLHYGTESELSELRLSAPISRPVIR